MIKTKKTSTTPKKEVKKKEVVKKEIVDKPSMVSHRLPENVKEEMSNTMTDMANMDFEDGGNTTMGNLIKTLTDMVNSAMEEVRTRQVEIMKGINELNELLRNQTDKNVDYMEMLQEKLKALDTVEDTLEREIEDANNEFIYSGNGENGNDNLFMNNNCWSGVKTT